MNRKILQAFPVLAIAALAACNGMNQSLPSQNDGFAATANGDVPFLTADPVRRLCPDATNGSQMQCFAMVRTDVMPAVNPAVQVSENAEGPCRFTEGYCPIDLQQAYDLPSLTRGDGKTVAIVDAYGYSHAASDLAYFRKFMGLKACDTSTKCLRIVNQNGDSSPLPGNNEGWDGEQSVDLDMVSGICPNCKIILVQANNNDTTNLYAAVKTAGRLGAKYIGASWGSGPEGGDNPDFHQPGVVITAAAGDNGGGGDYGGQRGGPIQPCTYTYVVCVGGTHLVRAGNKRGWSETVWNDWTFDECGNGDQPCGATGSACSKTIAKPPWQTDKQCTMRSAADVSATASLRAPVIVYNTQIGSCPPSDCFWLFGGTSASTQIIAGVYALAGNADLQTGASYFWKHQAGHVNDVTEGNNLDANLGVTCASSVKYICTARVGFDGPTGWGTP
jgi:subtilase family serine protease